MQDSTTLAKKPSNFKNKFDGKSELELQKLLTKGENQVDLVDKIKAQE